jgi:adenosylcobinamide-phosphate synthase
LRQPVDKTSTHCRKNAKGWTFLGAAAGLVADRVVGEPPASVPHPVAVFGRSMGAVERHLYAPRRGAGAGYAAVGVALGVAAGRAVRSTAVATYVAVAGRALAEAAEEVRAPLAAGDLEEARRRLPALAGRDPSALDEKELARAVVESVAENTVDAVVAPALWGALLGAPGALGYRAVNTMDAMVGHRSPRYVRFGTVAARLDDLAAWAPARITALLVVAARPRAAGAVWRAVRRDAPAHPSPNAGVAEAAFAAALDRQLGGTNHYAGRTEVRGTLGAGPPVEVADIERAVRLSRDVTIALAVGLVGLAGVTARRKDRER